MPARRSRLKAEDQEKQIAQCFRCGEWKPFSCFHLIGRNAGTSKRQTTSTCKECYKKANHANTIARRDTFSDKEKSAGVKLCNFCNVEKPVDQMVPYRGKHYKSAWMPKCKDCHRQKAREKYHRKQEVYAVYSKRYYAMPLKRADIMHHTTKGRCTLNGIEYKLSKEWFREKIVGCCEVTGLPFEFSTTRVDRNLFGPSVDRKDPDKGYTPDNCQMTVLCYNLAKNIGSHGDVARMSRALMAREPPAGVFTDRFVDKFH